MIETTLTIDGMMCGMCESHVNSAIRNHFTVLKVTSNAKKGQTVILSEQELPAEQLKQVLAESGYKILFSNSKEASSQRHWFSGR